MKSRKKNNRLSKRNRAITAAVTATAIAAGVLHAGAVPAWRGVRQVVQPDGSVIEIKKYGDERNHIVVTDDNLLLEETPDGYVFAKVGDDGTIIPTEVKATPSSMRTAAELNIATRVGEEEAILLTQVTRKPAARAKDNPGRIASSFPAKGDANVLVVLVEYQDEKFRLSDPRAYFDGMLNKEGFSDYGGTGCAKEYFKLNSLDQFKPHFNVYGPITLPENMAYYGGNENRSDRSPGEMVIHACEALDNEIDFHDYDLDGDGAVDNVFVIYAGQGEATYGGPDTVWPHSGDLLGNNLFKMVDGLYLNHYACCNEWVKDRPDGVGTFIHEFSHVIGLPDLYATTGSRLAVTPGSWSVLDYGPYNNNGCTPPNYSAYERYAMGWTEPESLGETANIFLDELSASNRTAIINVEGTDNEFFLFENRRQVGWDKYLPAEGMLVWHVDYDASTFARNEVNNDEKHQRVDLIEANGDPNGLRPDILPLYPFPGATHNTSLDFNTKPSLQTWSGRDTGVAISDIESLEDGRIFFRVNGGVYNLDTPNPVSETKTDARVFRADWEAVEGAESYDIEVTATFGEEAGEFVNAMGSGSRMTLPEGWSSMTTSVYSTSGNFGEAAPSYKMETDGDWMLSPEMNSDVMKISFWYKGVQTSGSTIDVLGQKGDEWVTLHSVEPANNVQRTAEFEVAEQGIRRVKFVYNMKKGRVALDDIHIVYGRPDFKVDGYAPMRVTDGTSAIVDCSNANARRFSWRVRARKGDEASRWSEPRIIELDYSGIAPTTVSSDFFTVQGRIVSNTNDALIKVYDVTGRIVTQGVGSVEIPSAGLYIVTSGDKAKKIICK